MKNKVLITAATGATGGNAIASLLEQEIPIRALVHKLDSRSAKLAEQGVEIVQGDVGDFDALSQALRDIKAVYFCYPISEAGILESTAYLIQAALENGVASILNMSQATARLDSKSHAARNHWIAERVLDRSGIPVTHLRPTLFAEWLMYFSGAIRAKSILPLPFADARYAPIASEDQGRVIAAILADPTPHAGLTYSLRGPRSLSQYDIADILTRETGRKITYIPLEIEAFGHVLKENGYNDHQIQHLTAIAQDFRDGIGSETTDTVEKITGQKPLSMEEYVAKNRDLFL